MPRHTSSGAPATTKQAKQVTIGPSAQAKVLFIDAHRFLAHVQRATQQLIARLNLIGTVGQLTANHPSSLRPVGISTSAQLNFSGTSNDAESLGGSVTASAARPAVDHAPTRANRVNWGQQIGGIEGTRSPLIEVSAGAISLPAPSSRFKGLRLVAATADTLQTSIVHTIGERLSATPIAAMFGFDHGNATQSDNSPVPSGGSGGKTSPPASPTAVLTTPLALAIAAIRVTYAQISTVFADITLPIYVPPG